MRQVYGTAALGLALALSASCASAQNHYSGAWDAGGIEHLEYALYDVYDMPIMDRPYYIDPEEMPVIYLLAREAGVSPEVVIALREQGWSWLDITTHLRVDPYVYVRHLPYDHGYWGWQRGRSYRYLTDRHIIDYVNLYFWATYHRRPYHQVIVIRQRIPTWHYYVVYHSPRIVVRAPPPPRYNPPRRSEVGRRGETDRRAQPRDEARRTVPPANVARPPVNREAETPRRTVDVRDLPTRGNAGAPTQTRTPDRASIPVRTPPQGDDARRAPQQRPTQVTPPTRPAPQATRPAPQATRPTPQATRPAPQATRPAPEARRPAPAASRPAAQPTRPAAERRPSSGSSARDAAASRARDTRSSSSDARPPRRGSGD
jgi:hypothetical protein